MRTVTQDDGALEHLPPRNARLAEDVRATQLHERFLPCQAALTQTLTRVAVSALRVLALRRRRRRRSAASARTSLAKPSPRSSSVDSLALNAAIHSPAAPEVVLTRRMVCGGKTPILFRQE
jgi:hypothetical protein